MGLSSFPPHVVWKVGWVSNETAEAPSPQIRGLETISTPRHNGRSPDNIHLDLCTTPYSAGNSHPVTHSFSETSTRARYKIIIIHDPTHIGTFNFVQVHTYHSAYPRGVTRIIIVKPPSSPLLSLRCIRLYRSTSHQGSSYTHARTLELPPSWPSSSTSRWRPIPYPNPREEGRTRA